MLLVVTNFLKVHSYNLGKIVHAIVGIWKNRTKIIEKKKEVFSVDAGTSEQEKNSPVSVGSHCPPLAYTGRKGYILVYWGP